MKDLLGTLAKLVVLLVVGALALYGAFSLYKKLFAKPKSQEFVDTLDYDNEFGYDDAAFEEDRIAQKIRSAKDKLSDVLNA